MNDARRKIITEATGLISDAINKLSEVRDAEQDSFDNLPEGLQQAENGEAMEAAIQQLEKAISDLENAQSTAEEAGA